MQNHFFKIAVPTFAQCAILTVVEPRKFANGRTHKRSEALKYYA